MIDRIYLLDGDSGYEVFRFWLNQLRVAFDAEGVRAEIVGIHDEVNIPVTDHSATFGFNLIRAWHPAVMHRKHFVWMVDPPPYHGHFFVYPVTKMPVDPARCIVGCVDEEWAVFAKEVYGYQNTFFLPHAASLTKSEDSVEREFDAVFLGGLQHPDTLLQQLRERAGGNWKLIEEFIDMMIAHSQMVTLGEGMKALVQRLQLPVDKAQVFINIYYPLIDRYLRNRDRLRMMQNIGSCSVEVYGAGDWKSVALPECITIHDPVSFNAVSSVMSRSRVVINHSPTHCAGLHERILDALMCGAAVVTSPSACVDRLFKPHEGVVSCQSHQVDSALAGCVKNAGLDQSVRQGQKTVTENHTLRHRVREILRALSAL